MFDKLAKVVLFCVRDLGQFVFMVMSKEIMAAFPWSCNVPLQITCEQFIKVILVS